MSIVPTSRIATNLELLIMDGNERFSLAARYLAFLVAEAEPAYTGRVFPNQLAPPPAVQPKQ
jgi:hypothetical protein